MAPYRTLCDVLDEMRSTYKTRNFASLLGLIEEAQMMGNRMEAKLDYYKYRQEKFDHADETGDE